MARSTCIAVVGVFRTGSSCIASILTQLGVNMGDELLGGSPGNPLGFFEDIHFLALHKKIVGDWRDPQPDFEKYRKAYVRLVREREKHRLWGIKDPRLCFLFPYLAETLKATTKLKVIHPTRKHEESVASLVAKGQRERVSHTQVDEDTARVLVQLYHDACEESLEAWGGPVLAVPYGQLLYNPAYWVEKIATFSGVPVTPGAVAAVRKDQRHI